MLSNLNVVYAYLEFHILKTTLLWGLCGTLVAIKDPKNNQFGDSTMQNMRKEWKISPSWHDFLRKENKKDCEVSLW